MATDKEIIQQLVKIAEKQQKIIHKLAQAMSPGMGVPALDLPSAAKPNLNELKTLLDALAKAGVKVSPQNVKVLPNEVHVRFDPGQDTDANWNALMAVVQATLPGKTVKTV
jgi:hypothetical protein